MKKTTKVLTSTLSLLLVLSLLCFDAFAEEAQKSTYEAPSQSMLKAQLFRAIRGYGKVKTLEELLAKGADPNAKDNYGRTALMKAVEGLNPAISGILITAGADVNARDDMGMTAIMRAKINKNEIMVQELTLAGATMTDDDLAFVNNKINEIADRKDRQKRLRDAKILADKIKADTDKMLKEMAEKQAEEQRKVNEASQKRIKDAQEAKESKEKENKPQ